MHTVSLAASNKYISAGLSTPTNRLGQNNGMAATSLPMLKNHSAKDIFFSAEDSSSDKRKAQNRAAQRAFRERKEQKITDLEQRAEELTVSNAATDADNDRLRKEIASKQAELTVFKSVFDSRSPQEDAETMPNFSFPPHLFTMGPLGVNYKSQGLQNHFSPGESKILPATKASFPWREEKP